MTEYIEQRLQGELLDVWLPSFSFAGMRDAPGDLLRDILGQQAPLLAYGIEETGGLQIESGGTYEKILLQEGMDEDTKSMEGEDLEMPEESAGRIRLDDETAQLLLEENQTGSQAEAQVSENALGELDSFGFIKSETKRQEYDWITLYPYSSRRIWASSSPAPMMVVD